jgi:steroid 5-alpha reductase family enzyme
MCLYQWACSESHTFYNWTFAGALGYLILFQASTWFTEKISAEKYPEYKVYQKRVGKFIPHAGTESMDEPKKVEEKKEETKAAQSTKTAKGKAKKR